MHRRRKPIRLQPPNLIRRGTRLLLPQHPPQLLPLPLRAPLLLLVILLTPLILHHVIPYNPVRNPYN